MTKTKTMKVHNLPFNSLMVGDSFVTDSESGYVRTRASQYARKLGFKFTVHKVTKNTVEVTRIK